MITIDAARQHSDGELLSAASRLAAEGRHVTTDLVALLAVLVERQLFAGLGYGSAHDFCVGRLLLSDGQAYHRLAAAQVARRFPQALEGLRDGRLTMTNLALLRQHLTDTNGEQLLTWAEGRRKADVERFVRGLSPLPDVAPSVRRTPMAGSTQTAQRTAEDRGLAVGPPPDLLAWGREAGTVTTRAPSREQQVAEAVASGQSNPEADQPSTPSVRPRGRAELRTLGTTRYSLRVTISEETHAKLRRAQDLLGHAVAAGDLETILDRALTALVEQLETTKFAARKRKAPREPSSSARPAAPAHDRQRSGPPSSANSPGSDSASNGDTFVLGSSSRNAGSPVDATLSRAVRRSRYIPAAVRRAVWARDEGRCSFVGPEGRCQQTRRLEFHHRVPFAERGASTVANVVLACTVHNHWEAARWFRDEVVRARAESVAGATRGGGFDQSKMSGAGPPRE